MSHARALSEPYPDAAIAREMAAILRGEPCRPADPARFARMALVHRVAPLLVAAGASSALPPEDAGRLRAEARRMVGVAAMRDRECTRVLDLLGAHGVPALVIKGAHLANSYYPASFLRIRYDTDLLIDARDLSRVRVLLAGLGYASPPVQTSGVVHGQVLFDRADAPAAALDVHWRVTGPRVSAALLDFHRLREQAVGVPRLGSHAFAPRPADALALACVHQAAHHPSDPLIGWMYDIHLLLESFDAEDEATFLETAVRRRMARLCAAVIERASDCFPSGRAERIRGRLAAVTRREPSARLVGARTRLQDFIADLREAGGWERARLLAAHAFPPPDYMRQTYAAGSRVALPRLYARRLASGAWRWLRGAPV